MILEIFDDAGTSITSPSELAAMCAPPPAIKQAG